MLFRSGINDDDARRGYDLILKDKERLLSLDEPVRFVFSHSALREGWDNPNIFQICTLKESGSETSKRQEVGRGVVPGAQTQVCTSGAAHTAPCQLRPPRPTWPPWVYRMDYLLSVEF